MTNKPLASPNGIDLKENAVFDALYCDFINGKITHVQLQSDDNAIHVAPADPKSDSQEFQIPLVNINAIPLSETILKTSQ